MPNETDLAASALPALSTERYSTVWSPSAEIVTWDANGFAPAVLAVLTQSPWVAPVFTRYSV